MLPVPIPANESQRQAALDKLHILDTPIEERYERITRLACRSLDVPIAAFTLIDNKRQWFKSIQGIDGSEVTRDISFCTHTILGDDIMLVYDAKQDDRFRDNPQVKGAPYISFYAGCPVREPSGEKIGSLCAVDTQPRILSATELQTLRDLAALIETELKANILSQTQSNLMVEADKAKRLAMLDPLTRLWNRKGMHELMKSTWENAQREKSAVSVAMLDIDAFAALNRNHGQKTGDAALRTLSRKLLSVLWPDDVLARVGNDEFMILFAECNPAELPENLERIYQSVLGSPSDLNGREIDLHFHVGAASMKPGPMNAPEDLVSMANQALQKAKKSSRNPIEIAA